MIVTVSKNEKNAATRLAAMLNKTVRTVPCANMSNDMTWGTVPTVPNTLCFKLINASM